MATHIAPGDRYLCKESFITRFKLREGETGVNLGQAKKAGWNSVDKRPFLPGRPGRNGRGCRYFEGCALDCWLV